MIFFFMGMLLQQDNTQIMTLGDFCILGLRGVITLKNSLNYPAEFTWAPNLGEKGTAFSIRPATGKLFTLTCILQSTVPFFLCNQKDFDQYLLVIFNFM